MMDSNKYETDAARVKRYAARVRALEAGISEVYRMVHYHRADWTDIDAALKRLVHAESQSLDEALNVGKEGHCISCGAPLQCENDLCRMDRWEREGYRCRCGLPEDHEGLHLQAKPEAK
jgi:hypothetical protein